MDMRRIEKLIELAKRTGITEIKIEENEGSVHIVCAHAPATLSQPVEVVTPPTIQPVHEGSSVATAAITEGTEIKSPMVGTMYHAASPMQSPLSQWVNRSR